MVGCPGCGSKLVYDIGSRKMKCSYCGSSYPVSQVSNRKKNAEESIMEDDSQMEVTVFTCTQCGGEIIADADEAVTWCSYCGSPTTLNSRLCRMKKPDTVIPFQVTKEKCIEKYLTGAKKQIYAPRDLIQRGKAEGFRGIYMPYWTYTFERKGSFSFTGTTEEYSDDYKVVTNYKADGNLFSRYEGLSHDASAAFDDSISEKIAPFWMSDAVPFDECYLNGFYGDAADQNEKEYEEKMYQVENELVMSELKAQFSDIGLNEKQAKNQIAGKQQTTVESSSTLNMYPIWFMSYKNGDRVSYATVNGQTGRLYADFPASPARFLLLSLLGAIPIFFLLCLFATPSPSVVLFLGLIGAFLMSHSYKKVVEDLFSRRFRIRYGNSSSKKKRVISVNTINSVAYMVCFVVGMLLCVLADEESFALADYIGFSLNSIGVAVGGILTIIFLVRFFRMRSKYIALSGILLNTTNLFYLAIACITTIVFGINPVEDWAYYTVSLSVIGALCVSVYSLIRGYNILSSVQPKQFRRNGGEGFHE